MRNILLALFVLVVPFRVLAGSGLAHLDSELEGLKSDTALLFPSQAIDEHALWSLDGRYLAVNVEGIWQKIDLEKLVLDPGKWRRGQVLGVITNREAMSAATPEQIAAWQKVNKVVPRSADVGGVKVSLEQNELSTALVVTFPGAKPEKRWQTGMENCHSLVVAPTKGHVAFICEMTGLFVLRVGR